MADDPLVMRSNPTQPSGEVVTFGPFRLFPRARLLERDGAPVELGGRALDILIALVRQAGSVVSRTDLMSSVWPDVRVVDGVLRVHVSNLRKALGDKKRGARYIESVAGRGYCFVAPVVRGRHDQAAPIPVSVAHGLPPRLERMAGRDEIVRALTAQVVEQRFVTIAGAAGIGKTTVAIAVAHTLLGEFGGAVHFIELGSLADPALVTATIAMTLGVPAHAGEALPHLLGSLRDKRVLLVLDNCEHVVDAAAKLAEDLFLHAPRVCLLATSREALRVEGERIHRLGPLEVPGTYGLSVEAIKTFPSVQVFLERASASGWSGELTEADVPLVTEICDRLDGVALALELAASFAGELGLRGAAAIVDDRLRLLWQPGRRTAPARQQTLHALTAWSYDRLPERERVVLARASVFIGSFGIDAAQAVAFEQSDSAQAVVEVMNELVRKSLMSCIEARGSIVYRMLETTRVYALERLAEMGEIERVRLLHASYFADHPSDLANVRAALKWCFSSPSGRSAGVRLAAAAARTLLDLGLVSECHEWSRRALDVMDARDAGPHVELELEEALTVSAMFSARGLDADLRSALARGLELARALGAEDHELRMLGHLNGFLIRIGDWSGALEVAKQSRAGTLRGEWMRALSHHCSGNHALAQEHCERGLRIAATSSETPMMFFGRSHAVLTLARTLWLRGQADRAKVVARPVVDEAAVLNHPVDKCIMLLLAEPIFAWRGEWGEAERLVDMLAEHAERYALASHRGVAMGLRGELLVKNGRAKEGCKILRAADSLLEAARNASHTTYVKGALAEGLAATGALDEALATIEQAIAEAERRGGTWDLPELLRLKGVILASASPGNARRADETLLKAIELAQRQSALALELRATTSLARERLKRGGSADDVRVLSAVYERFTEGLETADLRDARDLLRDPNPRAHQV
jgi:predicted ATPase/DNA-binding winged helix-turn-helix (wHTH) protein